MKIMHEFGVQIPMEMVERQLGYADVTRVRAEVRQMLESCCAEARELLTPRVSYVRYTIQEVRGEVVVIAPLFTLEGKDSEVRLDLGELARELANCSEVILALGTVGSGVEEASRARCAENEVLSGMMLDAVGTVALLEVQQIFWRHLRDLVKQEGLDLVGPFSPGIGGWILEDQALLYQLAGGKELGLQLTEQGMLVPYKSVSMLFGLGVGGSMEDELDLCRYCTADHCSFRGVTQTCGGEGDATHQGLIRVTVVVEDEPRVLWGKSGDNLLRLLQNAGIMMSAPCGGVGRCGKCQVRVQKGNGGRFTHKPEPCSIGSDEHRLLCDEQYLPQREQEHVTAALGCNQYKSVEKSCHLSIHNPDYQDHQLACQTTVDTELTVWVPCQAERAQVVTDGLIPDTNPMPGHADEEFGQKPTRRNEVNLLRKAGQAMPESEQRYGIAFDLGTTTVVGYLIDLMTGEEEGVTSALNPQRQYGHDVVSRIYYTDTVSGGLTTLHRQVIELFGQMIIQLTEAKGINSQEVHRIVVVGNPVMIHLFLQLSCSTLGQAPYEPLITGAWEGRARELGVRIHPDGRVYVPAGIAGYVGADLTAGLLASGLYADERVSFFIDIGTNGEMALGNARQILTCATAAGPAFEGAGILYGLGGIEGAIASIHRVPRLKAQVERLRAERVGKEMWVCQTIGGKPPIGICGSGIVDAVAVLLELGIVEPNGRISRQKADMNQVVDTPSGLALILAERKGQEPILLTQADLRQVQLAKAAIRAGVEMLLRKAGIRAEQVHQVYLAGGFGNYLRLESAFAIGLFPAVWHDRIIPMGNSAGTGAKMLLQNPTLEQSIAKWITRTEYVELATEPDFQELFIGHMELG
jgi:uncharacterized 2Fe-2S/4Fe-4S cluster protein (DUF4445 family)